MQVAIGSESSAVQYLNYATGKLGASVHVTSPMVYSIRPVGSEVRLVGYCYSALFVVCSHTLGALLAGCHCVWSLPVCRHYCQRLQCFAQPFSHTSISINELGAAHRVEYL